ncbi:MAG: dihydrofolate reductase [Actinomycetia bacterium]|nr:dihydrofolate reductase [Actinomycetes bacterium]MCH9801790.1 dihydrofolate reductase [Actinomycetes bacterium]
MTDKVVLLPEWLNPPTLTGLSYSNYDNGQPRPEPEVLAQVNYYVPPYLCEWSDIELAQQMPNLEVLQTLTAGVEGIQEILSPRVRLVRAAGVHDTSTAELTVGLIIASQRGIDIAARDLPAGVWRHERRRTLADSRIAIVGWGPVAQAIAARLAPFEAEVTAFSRSASGGAKSLIEFDRDLAHFDIVILVLPLTPQTTGFLGPKRLAQLQDGALVVNVGRGPLVDTAALTAETTAGRLRAALDVTDPEPLPPDHPLWQAPGVLITPHLGGNSEAFPPRARRFVAEQLRGYAAQQSPPGR